MSRPIWLLLLPCIPSEFCLNTLRVAYGPPLTAALYNASKQTALEARQVQIDIGVAYGQASKFDFSSLQNLFALLYKLNCVICTELKIDVEYDNDVDARFFLFEDTSASSAVSPVSNPLMLTVNDLNSLARCDRRWTRYCFVHSESGEGMLRQFLRTRSDSRSENIPESQVARLPGGLSILRSDTASATAVEGEDRSATKHRSVAVGGTFDHLHAGHKLLLTMTALLGMSPEREANDGGSKLTVGITGDELLKNKKYKEHLEGWHRRQESVKEFLTDYFQLTSSLHILAETKDPSVPESEGRLIVDRFQSGLEIRYAEIFDPFGPTITDITITALAISAETRAGGEAVNGKRREKGWPTLEVFEVGVLDSNDDAIEENAASSAEGFQNKLSSTEIRSRIHRKDQGLIR